jgi:hypothetical protein
MNDYFETRRAVLDAIAETKSRVDSSPIFQQLLILQMRQARISSREEEDYINWKAAAIRGENGGEVPVFLVVHTLRRSSPLEALQNHISKLGKEWTSDSQSPLKAYILACLSELTYMRPTPGEIEAHERYRIRHSRVLDEIVTRRPSFDVDQIMQNFEINTQQILRQNFAYTVYAFTQFTVVSVRGTATVKDWGIDANALRIRVGERHYHAGFLGEVLAASPELQTKVGDVDHVYFTGHSLGGAVAAMLPHFWQNPKNLCMTPYVFASPRYCDYKRIKPTCCICGASGCEFARQTAKKPYGYVFEDDLVPHLPPTFLGYSNYKDPPMALPAGQTWMSGTRTFGRWLWGLVTLRVWKSKFWQPHMIEGYRRALGEIAGINTSETAYVDAIFASHAKSPATN